MESNNQNKELQEMRNEFTNHINQALRMMGSHFEDRLTQMRSDIAIFERKHAEVPDVIKKMIIYESELQEQITKLEQKMNEESLKMINVELQLIKQSSKQLEENITKLEQQLPTRQ